MTIIPLIQKAFTGTIWRMEIDELSNVLFLEIRDNSDKQVSFTAIDLQTGNVNFTGLTLPERWLTGIECAFNGVLLLHNYQSENAPVHKAVIAIDSKEGNVLWTNYNIAFDHLSSNGPILYDTRLQPRKLLLADITTGATKRVYERCVDQEPESNIKVPEIKEIEFFPAGVDNINVVGNSLFYLNYNNYRIVSLHKLKQGLLSQFLIVSKGDDVIYEDLLNAGIQKIQPEAFIMHRNRLIYVKNRTDLVIIVL